MDEAHATQAALDGDAATLAAYPELAVLTLDLPGSDGEPMETERERFQINLLLDALDQHWHDRTDWYAGGNMFLYSCVTQARQILDEVTDPTRPRRAFRGPDAFIVLHVDGTIQREKWVVWEEGGRYPDVIFEFLSPSTARGDKTTKKALYEQVFHTGEYYWYDPAAPAVFQGWHLRLPAAYQEVTPDPRGWLWSPALQLWIGTWVGVYKRRPGTWLRFYDAEGRVVLTSAEAEHQRAEAEHQRAEAAEAELARLRAELAQRR